MMKDQEIFNYLLEIPGDNLAISRMVNWFVPYMQEKNQEIADDFAKGYKGQSTLDQHESLKSYFEIADKWNEKCEAYYQAQKDQLPEKLANGYTNCRDSWMAGIHEEVIDDPMP